MKAPSKPLPSQEQEQEHKQEQKQDLFAGGAVAPAAAPIVKKPAKAKPSTAPTAETWDAYADAYRQRYSVEPVRNASVNGQLANFVSRLAAEEAPQVAAFYVWHNNRYYAQQMHSVAAMVKDAEKLRTEWATGNRMTAAQAVQADKTQTNGDVFGKLIREAQDARSHTPA